jgi:hypothetical protein
MSSPVRFMVAITLSRLTVWLPSPSMARRMASMAFTAPMALRSMQGICTSPPIGIAGEAQVVLHGDLGGVLDLGVGGAQRRRQPGRRHRTGHADLALAADLGAGDRGVASCRASPMAAAVIRKVSEAFGACRWWKRS